MPVWIPYIVTFVSGGLAGAFLNRYFSLKDRAIKKLTLRIDEEEVKSIIPVVVNGTNYQNLIYKKFTLINSTSQDFSELDVIFEFDKDSEIVSKITTCSKHGTDKYNFTARKSSELVYHVRNFNRKQELCLTFEVGNISENFFSAIIDNCGVEITIVHSQQIRKSSVSLGKIVQKIALE